MLDVFDLPNNIVPNYKDLEAEMFSAYGSSTHADLVLSPKGDGAVISGQFPNGSVLGGNPRGAYAIDLQADRGDATQVAHGFGSIVLGLSCTASNTSSIAIGSVANSSGFQSLAIGSNVTSAGEQSIAIGTDGTSSSGLHSIAIGDTAIASAQDACAIGVGSIASAQNAFAYGESAVAATSASMALGLSATTARLGELSFANGFAFTTGSRQYSMFLLQRVITTNAAAAELTIDGNAPTATNTITIPSGKVMGFIAWISGVRSTGASQAHFTRKGFIKNVAGTTSITTTPVAMGADEGVGTLVVGVDDTTDALRITMQLAALETWRFVAVVQVFEFTYGT